MAESNISPTSNNDIQRSEENIVNKTLGTADLLFSLCCFAYLEGANLAFTAVNNLNEHLVHIEHFGDASVTTPQVLSPELQDTMNSSERDYESTINVFTQMNVLNSSEADELNQSIQQAIVIPDEEE